MTSRDIFRDSRTTFILFALSILVFLFISCGNPDPINLSFTFGQDDSGITHQLINQFNKEYKGKIKVDWNEAPRSSSQFFHELNQSFEKGDGAIEVFGSDVIWTAHLADKEWVMDINDLFYSHHKPDEFIEAAMQSAVYQNRVYGIPWFTDIGLLYYRKDLFEQVGLPHPPVTWDQVIRMTKKIKEETGVKYGMVFQGEDYEGGTVNAMEFIWNAGGEVVKGNYSVTSDLEDFKDNPDNIVVADLQAIQGLHHACQLVDEGLAPENIDTYLEKEALDAFVNGEAILMRNWPGIYAVFNQPDAKVKSDQVGIAALPISKAENDSYSCLGGWNLMINASLPEPKLAAAKEFLLFMTDQKQQKFRAMKGSNLPSLIGLYEDEELLEQNPIAGHLKYLINNARIRPVSTQYHDISRIISGMYNKTLKGETDCDDGLAQAQADLTALFEKEME